MFPKPQVVAGGDLSLADESALGEPAASQDTDLEASAEPSEDAPPDEGHPEIPEEVQSQLNTAISAVERLQSDLAAMKSSHDKSVNQLRNQSEQREQELIDYITALETEGMDDEAKQKYLATRQNETLTRRSTELGQREQSLRERESRLAWSHFFADQIGLSPETLDMDGDFEAFHTSGWKATAQTVGTLRQRVSELEGFITSKGLPVPAGVGGRVAQKPAPRKPTKVVTGPEKTPPGKRRLADIPMAERESLFTAFERREIPPDQMPT